MPIATIPGALAAAQLKSRRREVWWPSARTPDPRLQGVADVALKDAPGLQPGEPIFTMGSCFARNIEKRLGEAGFDTYMILGSIQERLDEEGRDNGFLNKYSSAAIRAELEQLQSDDHDAPLLSLDDGGVYDLLLNQHRASLSREQAVGWRKLLKSRASCLANTRVAVITLGVAEVWRDLETGLPCNGNLPQALLDKYAGRFVLEVLDYNDIFADLEAILARFKAAASPGFRLILSVSPVPLRLTYRQMDVLVANGYSKAVQRAAAEAFAMAHPDVLYFPSYEMVTLTDRRLAFESDNRHVQATVVDTVIDRFLRAYCPEAVPADAPNVEPTPVADETDPDHLWATSQYHLDQGDTRSAIAALQKLVALGLAPRGHDSIAGLQRLASVQMRAGEMAEARRTLEALSRRADLSARHVLWLADRYLKLREAELARAVLGPLIATTPDDAEVVLRLAVADAIAGRTLEARHQLERLQTDARLDDAARERATVWLARLGARTSAP